MSAAQILEPEEVLARPLDVPPQCWGEAGGVRGDVCLALLRPYPRVVVTQALHEDGAAGGMEAGSDLAL